MISTFENAERQHLRRLERERHMTILNTITGDETFLQLSLENDDIIPTLDTVAGEPRATPVRGESQASETNKQHRWLRNNTVWVVGVMLIVTTILLAFTLGVDLGEKEVTVSNSKPVIDDVDDSPPLHAEGLQRYVSPFPCCPAPNLNRFVVSTNNFGLCVPELSFLANSRLGDHTT